MFIRLLVICPLFLFILNNTSNAQSENEKDLILSDDYTIAEKALKSAIESKDIETICKGVRNFKQISIRQDSVDVMNKIGIRDFVPCLIKALEVNKKPYRNSYRLQNNLNNSVIKLLEKFTSLKLFIVEPIQNNKINEEDIDYIILITKQWWEQYKNLEIKLCKK